MTTVLLTTPVGPYDTHYYNQSLTDGMDQRFSRGCGIFTLRGHIHINFAHVLAQNIQAPTVFLEYPSWDDFEAELAKNPAYVGINGFHNQRDIVIEMCKRARELASDSTILIGGWAGIGVKNIYSEEEWKVFADDICEGDGVVFMREKLGEDTQAPVDVSHLPKCSAAIPWIEPHPRGDMGSIVASLGCPHGCDFCGTTHMYSRRRLRLLKADKVFAEMKRYFRDNEKLVSVNLIEEDSFADPKFIRRLSELVQTDVEFGLERLNFFCLSSNVSLSKFDFDDILKTGVSSIFIGVESKFAPEEGYKKRDGRPIEETFRELHRRGISTLGAWMFGFDFQNRENVQEDLNAFIALEPTFQQLTRLCPFPGTTLWRQVVKEGRIDPSEVLAESISFFGGGGMVPKNFYDHEIMQIIEGGYTKLYEIWGACLFRQWKVVLNGFEYCSNHDDPIIRRRAKFHRRMCRELYPLTLAMEVHAPNGTVRKRVRDQRSRYFRLFGEPSSAQKLMEKFVLRKAHKAVRRAATLPINFRPKEEPYKRYEYARTAAPGQCPYTVTHPTRELSYQLHDLRRRARDVVFGWPGGFAHLPPVDRQRRQRSTLPRSAHRVAMNADKQLIITRFGEIAFTESGSAGSPPVLLVHGIPTSSYLWRRVTPHLAAEFHCLAPDLLGLGDTRVRPDADVFHMNAQAEMLVEFMAALGHERFALVCHDQGGAAAQIIAARHPEKITCFVLTNCVCYDNWPVPVIRRLQRMARRHPVLSELMSVSGLSQWIETSSGLSSFRRGVFDPKSLTDEAIREYLRPMRESRVGRERFRSFLLAGDPSYTMAAVEGLRRFEAPTLMVWAKNDLFLPPHWGERLAADIPGCDRLKLIDHCGHFWQEERQMSLPP